MLERDTTTQTIGDHTYEIKTYATAREVATIQQSYFRGSKIDIVAEQPRISEFNPNVQFDVQLEMIRSMVVSMDGTTEDIPGRCEDLPSDEFDELIAILDPLVSKKKR